MSYDQHNFPQDGATGVEETVDWDDAGAFAQLAYDLNTTDYVLDGFEFTNFDFSAGVFNVTSGVARVSQPTAQTNDHSDDDGPAAKTLQLAAFVTQAESSGDLALDTSTVNHVFIAVDQSTNDRTLYRVNTDGTEPAEPSLKLGTIDGANQTYSYVNRLPTGEFSRLEITAPPTDQSP